MSLQRNYKLEWILCTDIDGTILGDNRTEQAFSRFIDQHRPCTLSYITSRSLESVESLVQQGRIPSPDFICASVGTLIFDARDAGNALGKAYLDLLPLDWDAQGIRCQAFGVGIKRQPKEEQTDHKVSFFWDGRKSTLQRFKNRLRSFPSCTILPSSGRYIDVIPSVYGKGKSVSFLCQQKGWLHDRVVVAGDTETDLSMYYLGLRGILPSNALPVVKKNVVKLPKIYQSKQPYATGVLEGLRAMFSPINSAVTL